MQKGDGRRSEPSVESLVISSIYDFLLWIVSQSNMLYSINGQHVSREGYDQVVREARRTYNIRVESSRELLASPDATDKGISSVAHIQTFTLEDKKTGTQRTQTSLTISVIESSDGGKQLNELMEIILDQ
jgi:hypothetical protein